MILLLIFLALLANVLIIRTESSYLKIELKQQEILSAYFAEIYIGTPPQQQNVLLDTGSDLLLLKSSQCRTCSSSSVAFFDQQKSSSFSALNCNPDTWDRQTFLLYCLFQCQSRNKQGFCQIRRVYGTNNYNSIHSGFVGVDNIQLSLENKSGLNYYAGFETSFTGDNIVRESGILGLNSNGKNSIIYDWYAKNNITHSRKFSLCLQKNKGYFQLGTIQQEPTRQKAILKYKSVFRIYEVEEMSIESINLLDKQMVRRKGILIDSGSTHSVIPQQYSNEVVNILNKFCGSIYSVCKINSDITTEFNLDANAFQKCYTFYTMNIFYTFQEYIDTILPKIVIKINGTSFNFPPSQYLYYLPYSDNSQFLVCLGFLSSDQYILGANWMVNNKIIFHVDQSYMEIYKDYKCIESGLFSIQFNVFSDMRILIWWLVYAVFCCVMIYKNTTKRPQNNNQYNLLLYRTRAIKKISGSIHTFQ